MKICRTFESRFAKVSQDKLQTSRSLAVLYFKVNEKRPATTDNQTSSEPAMA